ncbi:MAG: hypothetical protein WBA98_03720 [Gordonia sp. (in: high G+C Gram-positive bacteria)]|uniref:hypothetical protein n=1 Tax=Gordonia sp. (in: high G+C Gram-positive bacteria) TaxID=84139 RepID=UPI003C755DBD
MTLRRVYVLSKHLPIDSATHFFLFGPVSRWGPTEHLLADLWEQARNKGKPKGKKWAQYPRPTVADRPKPASERRERSARRRAKLLRIRNTYGGPAG